jgi:hypothetical protein
VEHWFDAFAKRIAQVRPSRRETLAALTGGASAWMFGVGAAAGQSPAGCARVYQGPVLTQRAVATETSLTLQHVISFDRASGRTTIDLVVMRGGELVVSGHAETSAQGAPSIELRYGREIDGVRRATAEIGEWGVLQGKMDGRAFVAPEHALSMDDATFLDGRPRPRIEFDPALHLSLRRLSETAVGSACRTAPVAEPPLPPPQLFRREPRPEGAFRASQPSRVRGCDPCLDACARAAECVGALPRLIDAVFNVPSWAARVAPCIVQYSQCAAACYGRGGGCCPIACGPDFCCDAGETCMSERRACCPAGSAVCSGYCCAPGVDVCAADGFCGCSRGHALCANECCSSDQVCCNGVRCCSPEGCRSGLC